MRSSASRVDDSFRDPFMIEVRDFFAQNKIFEQRWTTLSSPKRILIVGKGDALISGEGGLIA